MGELRVGEGESAERRCVMVAPKDGRRDGPVQLVPLARKAAPNIILRPAARQVLPGVEEPHNGSVRHGEIRPTDQ